MQVHHVDGVLGVFMMVASYQEVVRSACELSCESGSLTETYYLLTTEYSETRAIAHVQP